MNELIQYCNKITNDELLNKRYTSSSEKEGFYIGKFYSFINTNYRNLMSFGKAFREFESVEGIDRLKWPKKEKSNQEIHKQYKNPMVWTRLFEGNQNTFKKTLKGDLFKQVWDSNFSNDEKWILALLLLLDSNLQNKYQYFKSFYEEFLNLVSWLNLDREIIFIEIRELFMSSNFEKDILASDLFILNTFYKDKDFLKIFFNSTSAEKEEFKNHIFKNFSKKDSKQCFISNKFFSTKFHINSIKDELKILYYSNLISLELLKNNEDIKFDFISEYCRNFNLNDLKMLNFIKENLFTIKTILKNGFSNSSKFEKEEEAICDLKSLVLGDDEPQEKEVFATYINLRSPSKRFEKLKPFVRKLNNYKCFFENINKCWYFPEKKEGNNYVEIHHLIPREFSGNFGYSIEVAANYVSLCPNCHRMLHIGKSDFKKEYIKLLYLDRKNRLKKCKLDISLTELEDLYFIN
ncbi:HNH endonuclease [Spiroplasma alleghenense]|uniref:HNH domain-containing protein n=1 Tax=Spiroplasma alleghenense TaxID=216931 RepID=A0A345Z4T9_9MOLU|nr:HNH endonuclease [Spiroplasma alleghenense]AXK51618.1 hypothetical protein SALLE_v1c09480 [Spiroplasma alleghenense]